MNRRLAVVAVVVLLAGCSGGKSNPLIPSGLNLRPLFTQNGTGNTVFDMPPSVARVQIIGTFAGFCQNFIVKVGGHLLVNEILGTCTSASAGLRYEGTHLTTGGVTEITNSNSVTWAFIEVR